MALPIVRTVAELRSWIAETKTSGATVGLVPTMGALHEGHLSLVREIRAGGAKVVTTLFVNPGQFGPDEDLATYPRDEAGDAAKLEAERASLIFAPEAAEMYPEGFSTKVSVSGLGAILEGEFRPGFFDGVATVVCKLLLQALPDMAIFGEKDYQQLQVIKRMVRDLNIPVEIVGARTVREADGLALSSRNVYLTRRERAIAPYLHRTIGAVAEAVRAGEDPDLQARAARRELLALGFESVDYVAVRHAETLQPLIDPRQSGRVLAAARLGRARLIDNVPV